MKCTICNIANVSTTMLVEWKGGEITANYEIELCDMCFADCGGMVFLQRVMQVQTRTLWAKCTGALFDQSGVDHGILRQIGESE